MSFFREERPGGAPAICRGHRLWRAHNSATKGSQDRRRPGTGTAASRLTECAVAVGPFAWEPAVVRVSGPEAGDGETARVGVYGATKPAAGARSLRPGWDEAAGSLARPLADPVTGSVGGFVIWL